MGLPIKKGEFHVQSCRINPCPNLMLDSFIGCHWEAISHKGRILHFEMHLAWGRTGLAEKALPPGRCCDLSRPGAVGTPAVQLATSAQVEPNPAERPAHTCCFWGCSWPVRSSEPPREHAKVYMGEDKRNPVHSSPHPPTRAPC